jgi:hypothetical protein
MLGNKALAAYSKPFSPKLDGAPTGGGKAKHNIPPAASPAKSSTPTIPALAVGAISPAKETAIFELSNELKSGQIKQADPRDFRKFTLADAKARNLRMGMVNKIVSPQRRAEVTGEIIEAARLKNAQHYVHPALQKANSNPAKQGILRSLTTPVKEDSGKRLKGLAGGAPCLPYRAFRTSTNKA